jgi:branched-chain amino acid transport system ATP-binding protein
VKLELQGVEAGYGKVKVLRAVDLVVPKGSVVALLGANGAGKTTLLRVASGLLHPGAGRVLGDGEDLSRLSPYELVARGICHVPEGRGIFPGLSVRENLVLQAPKGLSEQSIERAVAAFPRLGQRLTQLAGTLSGGEQQMLALVRAYIQSPQLVLLDEVSMGLAPKAVDEIFVFLNELRVQGVGLLVVEQYVARALEIADYVYVMSRGRIVFRGEPSELEGEDVFSQYVGTPG